MAKIKLTWGKAIQSGEATPVLDAIRQEARLHQYVGTPGIQEYVETQYNGKLLFNKFGEISGLLAEETKIGHLKVLS